MKKYLIIHYFLIQSLISFSQQHVSYEWYLRESNGGLCNESLLLFNDHTYCSESGCEASSHFTFGSWSEKAGVIKLSQVDLKNYSFVVKIEKYRTDDKRIIVKVLDKDGVNISNKFEIGQFVERVGTYNFKFDTIKNNLFEFKRNAKSVLLLKTFAKTFNTKIEIPVDTFNYFVVTLNISKYWNFSRNSDWSNIETMYLKRNGEKLSAIIPKDKYHGIFYLPIDVYNKQ